jgi:GWxTD domain-containing protein
MSWPVLAWLVPGMMAGLWPVFGSAPLVDRFPLEAAGDIRFQVDAARFVDDGRAVVELALAIPDGAFGASTDSTRLLTQVELLDGQGKTRAAFRRQLTLPPSLPAPADANPAGLQSRRWLRLSPAWLEETAAIRVRIEDQEELKTGLYDRIRKIHRFGEAAGRLDAVGGRLGRPGWISDLLFAWGPATAVSASGENQGLRGVRARLEPNPYRYYGCYQPVLTVYWERYPEAWSPALAADARLLATYSIVSLADTLEVYRTDDTLRVGSHPDWSLKRLDLSNLPAGTYACRLTLGDPARPQSQPLARSEGSFQIIWEKGSWMLDEAKLLAYGRALLPSNEFERFSRLDRGGMETYLRDLWNRHWPGRPDEPNELEQRFLERVRYAEQNFRGQRPGVLSDRGLVYIRFGPPDELREQLNPQDEELLWVALPQELADDGVGATDPKAPLSRRRTRWDNSAYQIWDYVIRGEPLLPEYVNPGMKVGLKFIFVDEMGTGDFTLVYGSLPLL